MVRPNSMVVEVCDRVLIYGSRKQRERERERERETDTDRDTQDKIQPQGHA
jgi:hypothetical protein